MKPEGQKQTFYFPSHPRRLRWGVIYRDAEEVIEVKTGNVFEDEKLAKLITDYLNKIED